MYYPTILIPRHRDPVRHKEKQSIPLGYTHTPRSRCPLRSIAFPRAVGLTCCSLNATMARAELGALQLHVPALSTEGSKTAKQAIAMAAYLLEAVEWIQIESTDAAEKPHGAGWDKIWVKEKQDWELQNFSSFENATTVIREAAAWFKAVGELGYGVADCSAGWRA